MVNISPVLIHVVIVLVVIGVLLGLINRYIPMAGGIKSLLNGVVIIFLVIFVLQSFGILGAIGGFHF